MQSMRTEPGLEAQACNPSTWEAEAGSSQVQDQTAYIVGPYQKGNLFSLLLVPKTTFELKTDYEITS